MDLFNLNDTNGVVDLAVFTQGGWAVLEDGFQFLPKGPEATLFSSETCFLGEVAEGGTLHVTYEGQYLIPGDLEIHSELGATITNITITNFSHLEFDYTAPTWTAGTLGPKTDILTASTSQGTSDTECEVTIHLNPYIDGASTNYSINDDAAPTTGVEDGAFVVLTVEGGNFLPDGSLLLEMRSATIRRIHGDRFVGRVHARRPVQGRGRGDHRGDRALRLSEGRPDLIDGNANVGPVDLQYESPYAAGRSAVGVRVRRRALDFDDSTLHLRWQPAMTVPQRLTVGDINADGVPDLVALARQEGDAEPHLVRVRSSCSWLRPFRRRCRHQRRRLCRTSQGTTTSSLSPTTRSGSTSTTTHGRQGAPRQSG